MRTIRDLEPIDGKRVFIRCDFNVPKDEDGNITDDRRIRGALQTIRYCIDRDCRVILASHAGRSVKSKWRSGLEGKIFRFRRLGFKDLGFERESLNWDDWPGIRKFFCVGLKDC